ncbi:hypothetical protein DFH09DRAFT_1096565 [Mycena vulgaris]|nr:hypothetical protein DFH09DRAFT_1096565 [Mycena vulgaris]
MSMTNTCRDLIVYAPPWQNHGVAWGCSLTKGEPSELGGFSDWKKDFSWLEIDNEDDLPDLMPYVDDDEVPDLIPGELASGPPPLEGSTAVWNYICMRCRLAFVKASPHAGTTESLRHHDTQILAHHARQAMGEATEHTWDALVNAGQICVLSYAAPDVSAKFLIAAPDNGDTLWSMCPRPTAKFLNQNHNGEILFIDGDGHAPGPSMRSGSQAGVWPQYFFDICVKSHSARLQLEERLRPTQAQD